MTKVELQRLDASRRDDFCSILDQGSADSRECLCTAYYKRETADGPTFRESLFRENRSDGYLLYVDGRAAGWCQCGPWGSFTILGAPPPEHPDAWAVTCMVLAPDAKGNGLAHAFLREILSDLRRREVSQVIAFAHRLGPTYSSPLPELPESVCLKAGMTLERDHPECPRYGMSLTTPGQRKNRKV